MEDDHHKAVTDLCDALVLLENQKEAYTFLKDLCTPQEMIALAERWRVCRLLEKGDLSYREIHRKTGASLTTIGRVARFLKDEPYHRYKALLDRLKKRNE